MVPWRFGIASFRDGMSAYFSEVAPWPHGLGASLSGPARRSHGSAP
jgi:hypothetical protein